MAVSVGLVKKIILEHIGGVKVRGNFSNVDIGGKLAVVKSVGSKKLSSAVNDIISSNSALLQNPVAKSLSTITTSISGINDKISGLIIDNDLKNSMTSSISALQDSVDSHITHTNILSGVDVNMESLSENQLSFHEISSYGSVGIDALDMSKDDIFKTMSSVTDQSNTTDIMKSLDSGIPGGLTDILTNIENSNDTDISNLVGQFNTIAAQHKLILDNQRTSDLASQLDLKTKIDTLNSISSLLPENDLQKDLIGYVGTDALKKII